MIEKNQNTVVKQKDAKNSINEMHNNDIKLIVRMLSKRTFFFNTLASEPTA